MDQSERVGRHSTWAAVVIVAMCAVALALLATRHGPQVTNDSATYLAGARNLEAGRGFVSYDLQPITLFPPGLSLTLAGADRLGLDPVDAARILHAFAYGASVVLVFLLARRHVRREWIAVAAAAAVALSTAMLNVYTAIWSEPIYCLAAVGLILVLESLMARRGQAIPLAVAAGLIASVGFAYRYAGHVLLVLPVLTITVAAWRDGLAAVIRRLVPYLATAAIVPALVAARNRSKGSSAFGRRGASSETIGSVTRDTIRTLREWVVGGFSVPTPAGNAVLAGVLAVVILGLVIKVRRPRGPHPRRSEVPLLPIFGFSALYLGFLWASELSTSINHVSTRLLAPLFAPLVVVAFIALDALLDSERVRRRPWLVTTTAVIVVLVLAGFGLKAARHAQFVDRSGRQGSAGRAADNVPLIEALRAVPPNVPVYTNDPPTLYLATARVPTSFPNTGFPTTTDERYRIPTGRGGQRPVILVWKEPNPEPNIAGPDALRRAGVELEAIATEAGWTVYRITT